MPSLRVIYRSSAFSGRELALDQPVVRIGRDPSCQIPFDEDADRVVSRVHAEIRWTGEGPHLIPAPGRVVLLRKTRLQGPTLLSSGDVLELAGPGGPSFEVQLEGARPKHVIGAETVDSSAATLMEMRSSLLPQLAAISGATPTVARQPTPNEPLPAIEVPATLLAEGPAETLPAGTLAILPRSYARHRAIVLGVFGGVVVVSLGLTGWAWWTTRPAPPVKRVVASAPTPAPKPKPAPKPENATPTPKPSVAPPDPAVRHAFAMLRRAELVRQKTPPSPDADTQVRTAQGAYDAILKVKQFTTSADDTMALIRATARRLGECDGAMPVELVSDVSAALDAFSPDTDAGKRLVETMTHAAGGHVIADLVAALKQQGLPPTFVVLPIMVSGLRFDLAQATDEGPVAKGMWQLIPAEAKRLGLKVGSHEDDVASDPADERMKPDVEARKIAADLAAVYFGPAAGSALLTMAAYDHGRRTLSALETAAGVKPGESDPDVVSFWRLYEAGALPEAVRKRAIEVFVLTAALSEPDSAGFSFEPVFPDTENQK